MIHIGFMPSRHLIILCARFNRYCTEQSTKFGNHHSANVGDIRPPNLRGNVYIQMFSWDSLERKHTWKIPYKVRIYFAISFPFCKFPIRILDGLGSEGEKLHTKWHEFCLGSDETLRSHNIFVQAEKIIHSVHCNSLCTLLMKLPKV